MTKDPVFAKPYPPFVGLFSERLERASADLKFAACAVVGLAARLESGEPLTQFDRLLADALRTPQGRPALTERLLAALAMSFYAHPDRTWADGAAAGLAPEFFRPPPRLSPFAPDLPVRFRLPASADMAVRMQRRSRLNAALDAAFNAPVNAAFDAGAALPREDPPLLRADGDSAPPAKDGVAPAGPVKITTPDITIEKSGGKETITIGDVGEKKPPTYGEEAGEGDTKYGISLHAITALEEYSVLDDTIRWTFDGAATFTGGRVNFVKLISREHEDMVDVRQISDLGDYSFEDPEEHAAILSEMRLANIITLPGGQTRFGWFQINDFLSLQGKFNILETSGADLKDIIEEVFKMLQVAADVAAPILQAVTSGGAALVLSQVKDNQTLIALGNIIAGLIDESKTLFTADVLIDRADIIRAFRQGGARIPQDPERDDKRIFKASDVPATTVLPPGTPLDTAAAAVKVVDAGVFNALGVGNPVEYRVTWLKRGGGGFDTFEKRYDYLTAIRYEQVKRSS